MIILLLSAYSTVSAQDHCIKFSKEDKKTVFIEEGRSVSFVFIGSEEWRKGKIIKITKDIVFSEQPIAKKDILVERESNYITSGNDLIAFRMMAYNNTVKAVGKGTAVVLLVAVAIASGGAAFTNDFDTKNSKAKKKFFKNNIDFDSGWKSEIVKCS